MNLSIAFTGLCLFVPSRDRLTVLLPRHGEKTQSYRHNAEVRFAGWQGWMSLDNCELKILAKHCGGSVRDLPREVLNITELVRQKVDPAQAAAGKPGSGLAARIILPLPYKYDTAKVKRVKFLVSAGQTQTPRELIHRITYRLNDIEDLGGPWKVTQLGNGANTETLFDPEPDQDVSLEIRNVPRWDPAAKKGIPLSHFHGYLHMFPRYPDPVPELVLDEDPPGGGVGRALTAYTCMLGQGDHDP